MLAWIDDAISREREEGPQATVINGKDQAHGPVLMIVPVCGYFDLVASPIGTQHFSGDRFGADMLPDALISLFQGMRQFLLQQ